jgi:beta-glucosidase-like glycosyl hydrolase
MSHVQIPIPSERERKLYQLIIERLNGDDIHNGPYRQRMLSLARKGIGGFIIFGGKKDEIRDFISELNAAAGIPLFIASDIERGVAQQIKGTTSFPCPMAVAAALEVNDPAQLALLERALLNVAHEAIETGINMPLIPVLDVNSDPDNPIICTRAFSDDPQKVAQFGDLYVKVLEGTGLISCPKHFPGHGDTSVDSHISLPVIAKSYAQLKESDLLPFVRAVQAGPRSIMVGHLAIPSLDTMPASLSYEIITGLLRHDMGFKGLILTDALNMHALRDFGNVPASCLNAGVDLLLHPAKAEDMVRELDYALNSGELNESVVDKALNRILSVKEELRPVIENPARQEDRNALYRLLVDNSITMVKETPGILPLIGKVEKTARVFLSGDTALHASSPLYRCFSDVVSLEAAAEEGGLTGVFALFTSVSAWKGSSGIPEEDKRRIQRLVGRFEKSVIVSFGSPYVLRYFGAADILIAAYEATEAAQEAVIQRLLGDAGFTGRLPVTLQYSHEF